MRRLLLCCACLPLTAAPAGPVQVDVSRAPGPQNESAIAIDPLNDRILVAGSNSLADRSTRVNGSTDAGATWTGRLGPPLPPGRWRGAADPAVAIGLDHRQYFAFAAAGRYRGSVFVASRAGPAAAWRTPARPTAPLGSALYDDKPAIAVDISPASPRRGRVYVAWTRGSERGGVAILVASSSDGARSWSTPTRVGDVAVGGTYASLAVAADGRVYVAWWVLRGTIAIASSTDGARHFHPARTVGPYLGSDSSVCDGGGVAIRAAPAGCVRPNPVVSVAPGRVYVTWSDGGPRSVQEVFLASFDPALRPLEPKHAVAPGRGVRFWPVSAVDASSGTLWVCFYEALGRRARFTCTTSADGGATWSLPTHAASVASDETRRGASSGSHGREYGDYEGLAVANGVAHPIWTDTRDLRRRAEEIYTTALRAP